MGIITAGGSLENPVLIDKYMMGTEVEVDAISDGEDFLIPGIMEHVERAGIHSGDSISVYPCRTLSERIKNTIIDYTGKLARALKVSGMVNVQYVVYNDEVYVIEVNPRSSRTVPYISKVTGVPMVDLATQIMLGAKLRDLGYGTGLYPNAPYVAVKVPVFSFEKLTRRRYPARPGDEVDPARCLASPKPLRKLFSRVSWRRATSLRNAAAC